MAVPVDVNQASAQQLQAVKGIGAKTAQRIVQERARGNFESLAHLAERLSGIGPKTLVKLKAAGLCAGSVSRPCTSVKNQSSLRGVPQAARGARANGKVATPEVIQIP
jgi:competence protein ComEA